MALTIQERLKDLRVERGLTLEQLAEQTHLSKSALGSYEAEDFKDISHYALIKLAKFYGVTAAMFQTMQDALAEQKQEPLFMDNVTAMITGQIGQLLPMDEETAGQFQQLAKKMMVQMSKSIDKKKGD